MIIIWLQNFREEIASCMEAAYKRMVFTEAGNMLYFKKQEELVEFAKEVKKNSLEHGKV